MLFTYTPQTVQDHLQLRATQLHEAAENLPHGGERQALVHRAHRMEDASRVIDRWMMSSGLRAPK
jgi:hypothetical protein